MGLASGCSARNVTTAVHIGGGGTNVTVTFCTHFSVTDLHGPLEKVNTSLMLIYVSMLSSKHWTQIIFGLMVGSILLSLPVLYNLVFSLCTRLGGLNTVILATQVSFSTSYVPILERRNIQTSFLNN